MDLRHELIRLACDNRASAQPLSRFGIFPIFPEPGKGERASVRPGASCLKETVLAICPDYSDRPTPDFLALSSDRDTEAGLSSKSAQQRRGLHEKPVAQTLGQETSLSVSFCGLN
jgi:hypothetical protein